MASLFFPDLPIHSAAFHPSGSSILLTGRRPFFYTYDLQTGQATRISRGLLGRAEELSAGRPEILRLKKRKKANSNPEKQGGASGQTLEAFKFNQNGSLAAFPAPGHRNGLISIAAFHAGGSALAGQPGQTVGHTKVGSPVRDIAWRGEHELMAVSQDDQIRIFDMRKLAHTDNDTQYGTATTATTPCVRRWHDIGGFAITKIAVNERFIAVGSKMGIVNIYDDEGKYQQQQQQQPPPFIKSLDNLTTSISTLEFNSTGEILAMASRSKSDALRLVHIPSWTTFSNWPTSATPLSMVQAIAFSKGSEMLAMGNEKGRVLLYALNHYAR